MNHVLVSRLIFYLRADLMVSLPSCLFSHVYLPVAVLVLAHLDVVGFLLAVSVDYLHLHVGRVAVLGNLLADGFKRLDVVLLRD